MGRADGDHPGRAGRHAVRDGPPARSGRPRRVGWGCRRASSAGSTRCSSGGTARAGRRACGATRSRCQAGSPRSARTAALFDHLGGPELAVAAVKRQAGGLLDPAARRAPSSQTRPRSWPRQHADDLHAAVLDAEPRPAAVRPGIAACPRSRAAFADVADLKSPYTLGHSSGVARLAADAGADTRASMPPPLERLEDRRPPPRRRARRHLGRDLGAAGSAERRRSGSRSGSTPTTRSASSPARPLARSPTAGIAGRHHERLDGIRLPPGFAARETCRSRLASSRPPTRPGDEPGPRPSAGAGPAEAAGRRRSATRSAPGGSTRTRRRPSSRPQVTPPGASVATTPAGLSEREVEVLRAVARGLSNREIAERFAISPRTAEHHVQHIYDKIGVSSRAAAAAVRDGARPDR